MPGSEGREAPRPGPRLGPRRKAAAIGALALIAVAAGIFSGVSLGLRDRISSLRLVDRDVSERFAVYVEGLSPSGKLVLLEGLERFTASREFTARILSLVRMDAKIEISALADAAYYVDLADLSRWKATWSPRGGTLRLVVPSPGLLPPAVRTDSIEIRTTGANLLSSAVFSLKRETEAMKADLSKDLLEQGRKALGSEELRSRLRERLVECAMSFCEQVLRVKPVKIEVEFAG